MPVRSPSARAHRRRRASVRQPSLAAPRYSLLPPAWESAPASPAILGLREEQVPGALVGLDIVRPSARGEVPLQAFGQAAPRDGILRPVAGLPPGTQSRGASEPWARPRSGRWQP